MTQTRVGTAAAPRHRPRVWELAAAAGTSTAEVRHRLEQLGHPVTSHASTVDAEVGDLFLRVVQPPRQPATEAGRARARLWEQVRERRAGVLRVLLLSVLATVAGLLTPFPVKLIADDVLGAARSPAAVSWLPYGDGPEGAVAWLALSTVLLYLLAGSLTAASTVGTVQVTHSLVYDVGRDVLARLQRRSPLSRTRSSVGDDLGRVMVDPYAVPGLLFSVTSLPVQLLLSLTVAVGVLGALDGPLAATALAACVVQTGSAFFYGRAVRRAALRSREAESRLQAHVHHLLNGISVVQSFVQEHREARRFTRNANRAVAAHQRTTLLSGLSTLAPSLTGAVGAAVVLYVGALRVEGGHLSVGGLLVFLAYLKRMQDQVGALARLVPQANRYRAGLQRVLEVLEAEAEVVDRPGARNLNQVRGHLVLESVCFGYEPGAAVLHDIDLEVRPGTTLALVGPSGAGKTTLLSLLPRFHDPWSGRILLDGHDLRDVRLHDLRRHISLVLQEPFLFPLTIADNIAYGRPQATRTQIEQAARDANAHDFITALPDGYDTVLGERGATLSGGERQRLSIARALLKDAPVLLLDEPTSALDNTSEQLLLQALRRLMKDRTTILIAHRLSTIRNADQIAVLDHGRITHTGTHTQLLTTDHLYAQLHRRRPARRARAPIR